MAAVELALAGITDDELDRAPAGEWSPRMVVHHLADSETSSYLRLRKLLAETDPVLQGYDEAEWARVLHYDRPIERSLAVFTAVREATGELLDELSDDVGQERARTASRAPTPSIDGWRSRGPRRGHADRSRGHGPAPPRAAGRYFFFAAFRALPRSAA